MRKDKGRKERLRPTLASTLLLLPCALFLGCAKSSEKPVQTQTKAEKPIVQAVDLGEGSLPVYPTPSAKTPSFTVNWKKGGFNADKTGVDTGHLESVSGDLYQDGKKSSAYSAPRGDADRDAKRLKLSGGVVLRSADGKQTMRAANAEYRDDVKLIRAVGDVTATGPFGTLSGVPELWATRDLHLIGTPDMVSKTLKIPALAALAATAAVATSTLQKGTDYVLKNRGSISAERQGAGARATIKPAPGGPLVVQIPARNVEMRASGTVVLLTGGKGGLQRATTESAVKIVQNDPKGGRSELNGTGAVYVPGVPDSALTLSGPVDFVSEGTAKGSLRTRGDRGIATLGGSGVRNATLLGNVVVHLVGPDGVFDAMGDRMVYTEDADGTGKVVLSGNLKLTGDVPGYLGDVQGGDILTVLLDKNKSWTNIDLTNSQGGLTDATIKTNPAKKGGKP